MFISFSCLLACSVCLLASPLGKEILWGISLMGRWKRVGKGVDATSLWGLVEWVGDVISDARLQGRLCVWGRHGRGDWLMTLKLWMRRS